jgi:hypothetical protein
MIFTQANKRVLFGICIILCVFWQKAAIAHDLKQSYLFLSINDTSIDGRLEINIVDLNDALPLNLPEDKSVKPADIQPHVDDIKAYFSEKISIDLGQGLVLDDYTLHSIEQVQFLSFNFTFDNLPVIPDYIDFEYAVLFDVKSDHNGFVVIENDWRSGTFNQEANIALVFKPGDTNKRLDMTGASVTQGYIEMLKLGIHHIWDGIDHILFLFALLLPAVLYRVKSQWHPTEKFYPSFIYVVKIVSVFTLAHTITLSAATLGFMSLSSRLVESIIAISIAIAALDMLTPIFRGRIWLVIFIFGLFHGFGFASVLASYTIPDSYLTWSLLAFNLGVEVGQVVIVAVVVPILFLLRNQSFYIPIILKVGAAILIVISMYWFIERAFEVDLPAGSAWNWFVGLFA